MTFSAGADGIIGVALKLLLQNMSQHPFHGMVGMHQYFTVQLYTTWRHPGLSFVYETSLTFRWLMTMIANCHLLTTTRRTDEGRGKNS